MAGIVSGSITGSPQLSATWKLVNGYLAGPHAVLANADLSGANLSSADLHGVNLSGATLARASFNGANLRGSDLSATKSATCGVPWTGGGYSSFLCAGPNFQGADLTGTNLNGANISGAVFDSANLTNANLTNATPTGVCVSYWGFGINYTGSPGYHSYCDGPSMSGVTLTGANLSGANLLHASLDAGMISGGVTGTPAALPAGWSLLNGYLVQS